MVDEEDVALSAFRCLCDRASSGRLTAVVSRHDLWRLLAAITVRKVIDQQRIHMQAKRGGGRVRGDSALRGNGDEFANAGFDKLIGDAAPPEAFAIAREQFQRLMGILDNDGLRQIVQDKLDGYRNDEIGQRLGLSRRSIERKLQWIRYLWESELEQ
jgi:hypothetical protein